MIVTLTREKGKVLIEITTTRKEWRQLRKGMSIINITKNGKVETRIKLCMQK